MKRSEMVLDINLYITSYLGIHPNANTMNNLAQNLLSLIEKNGMTPPEYLPEPQYCEVTGKQLECKPVRKWEKE